MQIALSSAFSGTGVIQTGGRTHCKNLSGALERGAETSAVRLISSPERIAGPFRV